MRLGGSVRAPFDLGVTVTSVSHVTSLSACLTVVQFSCLEPGLAMDWNHVTRHMEGSYGRNGTVIMAGPRVL